MYEANKHQSRYRWKVCYAERVLVLLYIYTISFVNADDRSALNRTGSNNVLYAPTDSSIIKTTGDEPSTAVEPLSTEPSVTSVHRVWTSTSRGSMDELSPEMISKLRNDMPFLSAYALRPRLVGGPQVATEELSVAMAKQRTEANKDQNIQYESAPIGLESSATNTVGSRQVASDSLVPKLGDFSEFKVETSSTSKSEHHHRRKTSLKRNPNNPPGKVKRPSKVRESGSHPIGGIGLSGGKRRNRSSENTKRHVKSLQKSRRLRDRHHKTLPPTINIIRHGRYIEERKVQPNNEGNSNDLDVEMRAAGRDTTTMMTVDGIKSGANDMSRTKGGGSAKKRPFYEGAKHPVATNDQPKGIMEDNDIDRSVDEDAGDKGDNAGGSPGDVDYDASLDEDTGIEPKRVGDPDVEEDGDTVLVEPKSDGVDDDPSIESAEEGDDEMAGGREEAAGANGDTGRRQGREQPRDEEADDDGGGEEERGSTDRMRSTGLAGGGGVGATIGGTGVSSDGVDKRRSRDDDRDHADASPGVEFADTGKKGGNGASSVPDADDKRTDKGSTKDPAEDKEDDSDDRRDVGQSDDGSRKSIDSGRGAKRGDANERDDEDLDYRDESDERSSTSPSKGTRPGGAGDECDDHGKGHHEDHHHHHGIDWLRGAIPGEPGVDYPILSKSNSTEFNCRDQKSPGYYADVDSRCQVFHVCQADGRQDSFLCPNGTVFSQKTLVCVWWAGADCEDAPKYYHLNELLYKTRDSKDEDRIQRTIPSPQEAALDKGRSMGATEREDSSIDSLIRSMRRRQMGSNDASDVASADADDDSPIGGNKDEATKSGKRAVTRMDAPAAHDAVAHDIQRSSEPIPNGTSSRLSRSRRGNAVRRMRRASMKQALPKLRPGMKMRGRGFIVKAQRRRA